ncbi:MAG TPA: phosphate ABC transporter permease PstA [Acidimicrobiia bacterium]|nr:phosphate ABC transporter permease PstA [Acidimicrobiia bacterium]
MSTVVSAPTPPRRSILEPSRGVRARKARNLVATVLIAVCLAIATVPLVLVMVFVVGKGGSVFGWDFLSSDIPVFDRLSGGGMGPAVVGTLVITGTATLMSVPLGILGGIYLNEYGGTRTLARVVRFMAEVMTGVPSVVMGLFIYTVWVLHFKEQTGFAGALALGALMLPIVIRTTDEILRLVPNELREGSFALGSRKVRTIRTVVLPHAMPGIVSGSLLAVARAAGETAPLLFTIGITSKPNWNPFSGTNTTLSAQIFRNAASPFPAALERGYGAALALVLLVFLFTALARVVTAIYSRRASAA